MWQTKVDLLWLCLVLRFTSWGYWKLSFLFLRTHFIGCVKMKTITYKSTCFIVDIFIASQSATKSTQEHGLRDNRLCFFTSTEFELKCTCLISLILLYNEFVLLKNQESFFYIWRYFHTDSRHQQVHPLWKTKTPVGWLEQRPHMPQQWSMNCLISIIISLFGQLAR